MDTGIFRKEVLENRFNRPREIVAIHGFGPIKLLFLAMVVSWVIFFYKLLVSDYVLKERFIGVIAPAADKYLDTDKYPSVRTIALIIIPASSAHSVSEGSRVDIDVLDKNFSSLPPIQTKIVRILDDPGNPDGRPKGDAGNVVGIAAFPANYYLTNGKRVALETGKFLHAHIRTKRMSLLHIMLKPLEKIFAKGD